jgi:hypothetical protein
MTDHDRNEIGLFAAMLKARRMGRTVEEAYDLVYGESAPTPEADA